MASDDDVTYRRSVRNMSFVLAAIVITVFAAILVPPYLYTPHNNFQRAVSLGSPFGFALHLEVNTTHPSAGGHVLLAGWLNNTSGSLLTINASSSWPQGLNGLWGKLCFPGWPIGVGVIRGHYDQYNYTLGSLIPIPRPVASCPAQVEVTKSFILKPHSSTALVDVGGSPQYWVIQTDYVFGYALQEGLPSGTAPGQLPAGAFTVILADEWGDVLTTNFLVS